MFGVKLGLKPLLFKADIIGGLILGAGIALAGACPGTTLAQIGAGYRDAIFIMLGGIAGALAYGYFDAPITAFFAEKGDKVGFDQLLGLPFWMAAIAVAVLLAAVLWGLESRQSWREETGADNDGLMEPRPCSYRAGRCACRRPHSDDQAPADSGRGATSELSHDHPIGMSVKPQVAGFFDKETQHDRRGVPAKRLKSPSLNRRFVSGSKNPMSTPLVR